MQEISCEEVFIKLTAFCLYVVFLFIFYFSVGCPPSLRARLWRVSLGLHGDTPLPESTEAMEYESLKKQCHKYDMITDELLLRDIQTVTDDPRFFVFEVVLYFCSFSKLIELLLCRMI
jgi:hypothetical protein